MTRQWPAMAARPSPIARRERGLLAAAARRPASCGSTTLLNKDSAVGGIVLPVVLPAGGGAVERVARIGSGSAVTYLLGGLGG